MQPILQHLFQVSSLDDISRQRLEAFVEEYPSFGIGHYLLSRKLKAEDSEQYAAETQKTSLYFTNPLWLQWQLDNQSEPDAVDDIAEALTDGRAAQLTVEEEISITAGEGEAVAGLPVDVDGATEEMNEPSAADQLLISIQEAKGLRETFEKINIDFEAETAVAGETLPMEGDEPIHDEEAPFVLDEPEDTETHAPVEPKQPLSNEIPVASPEEHAATSPEEHSATSPEPELLFEPYHTIDYFASQGIKLTLEENPSDPLAKQLKSFTEWLKGMRRLPKKDREVIPDRVAEETVQTIAAHSIEGRDILTETMAEVFSKQGMREKARVVYEKLSLLNPEKRAYFAAKIEQLNIP